MITKFDSSYVGTVDMEELGYLGKPINDRRYSNAELASALHKAVAYAQKMDGLGYDTFWMAEHHFQPEGTECIPNLLMMAMHLVHKTKNLKIGCGFNVVPMWHPLRLAEDYAMADILSEGRVIFGVARGYHTREVETFGAPLIDQNANREHFEEGVDIVFKAFNEERFSHRGKYYTIPPEVPYRGYTLKEITLVPRPMRLPVECWQPIQSGSDRAFDFMAKHGEFFPENPRNIDELLDSLAKRAAAAQRVLHRLEVVEGDVRELLGAVGEEQFGEPVVTGTDGQAGVTVVGLDDRQDLALLRGMTCGLDGDIDGLTTAGAVDDLRQVLRGACDECLSQCSSGQRWEVVISDIEVLHCHSDGLNHLVVAVSQVVRTTVEMDVDQPLA